MFWFGRSVILNGCSRPVGILRIHRFKHHEITSTGSQHKIRNVGLIAHIDAGKTTTTEKMLYLAGRTRVAGDVDRGDTVTDYLVEERERGISIVSAAAFLAWRQHDIHLIDTPGHVDFTFEVERGLAAVDAALLVLDACKGVETQTRTVWSQADRYQLPRLIFINKMDRPTANVDGCLQSLHERFGGAFLPLQIPVFAAKQHFTGIIDLPSLTLKTWSSTTGHEGSRFSQVDLFKVLASNDPPKCGNAASGVDLTTLLPLALRARAQLLASLADLDDTFANEFLLLDNPELLLPVDTVRDCVRVVTKSSRGFPVMFGSSRRNIGVQPLLDAIVDYLPDPSEHLPAPMVTDGLRRIQQAFRGKETPPVLLTFKIIFDQQRGPLSLCRVFSGHVTPGMPIRNWTRQQVDGVPAVENVGSLLQLTGDVYESVASAQSGCIVALSGLQSTRTGDILGPVIPDSRRVADESDWTSENVDDGVCGGTFLPPPVVHAALEPRSSSAFRNLERALTCMQREDPSFKANFNAETGQWVVAGMGDLHLEVVLSRLRREYRLDVNMGPLLTSHREMPQMNRESVASTTSTGLVGGRQRHIFVELLARTDGRLHASNRPLVTFDKGWTLPSITSVSSDSLHSPGLLHKAMRYVHEGCEVAMATGGPLLGSHVVGVNVHILRIGQMASPSSSPASNSELTRLQVPTATTSQHLVSFGALLRSSVIKTVKKALSELPEWKVIEPVMAVEILLPVDKDASAPEASVAPFIGELIRRRGEIEAVEVVKRSSGAADCSLRALAPLSELQGLSATIRSLASGMAEISVRLADFRPVTPERQAELLGRVYSHKK